MWTVKPSNHRAFRSSLFLVLVAMLGFVACAGSSGFSPATVTPSGSGTATDVKVTLADFRVEAPTTSFRVGVPYRFVVTNSGTVNHEFMVVPPPKAGESSDDLDKVALGRIDDADFPPGITHTVMVTFTKPGASGSLEFACHVAGHYDKGMRAPITVTP